MKEEQEEANKYIKQSMKKSFRLFDQVRNSSLLKDKVSWKNNWFREINGRNGKATWNKI